MIKTKHQDNKSVNKKGSFFFLYMRLTLYDNAIIMADTKKHNALHSKVT